VNLRVEDGDVGRLRLAKRIVKIKPMELDPLHQVA